jgi:hypothetical protein
MSLQIENINYTPFHIKDWKGIHKELSSKYHIPDNITSEVGTSTYDWTYENFGNFHYELTKLLSHFYITVKRARFFYTAPNSKLTAHVDGTDNVGHNYWAINFPIDIPLTGHYQEWYEYKGEYQEHFHRSYTESTLLKNPEDVKLIDSLILNRPYLVKVGIPHAVYNHSSNPRLILSIRFNDYSTTQLMNLIKFSIEQETALGYARKIL